MSDDSRPWPAEAEARRRHVLRMLVGPGRPEGVWEHYEREGGPLSGIDHDHMRDLLRLQLQRADTAQEKVVRVPRVIVEKMLCDLRRLLEGKSPRRRRGAPRLSWWERRNQHVAIEAVNERKAELIAKGMKAGDALDQALDEVAAVTKRERATLESWRQHRSRHVWK